MAVGKLLGSSGAGHKTSPLQRPSDLDKVNVIIRDWINSLPLELPTKMVHEALSLGSKEEIEALQFLVHNARKEEGRGAKISTPIPFRCPSI